MYKGVDIQVKTLDYSREGAILVKLEKRLEDQGAQAWADSVFMINSQ